MIEDLRAKEVELIESWAKVTVDHLKKAMKGKYSMGVTGQLEESLRYVINKSDSGIDSVVFSFNLYGRFVDMGVGKGVPLGATKEARISRRAFNEKQAAGPHRKPKKWESKGFTGETYRLADLMMELVSQNMGSEIKNFFDHLPLLIN